MPRRESPEKKTFLDPRQRRVEDAVWDAAREIARQDDKHWDTAGWYVGIIAKNADEFRFASERMAYWVDRFLATKRPKLGAIAETATPKSD